MTAKLPRTKCILTLTTTLLAACATETVMQPTPPPVDWRSFDARAPSVDTHKISATEKERAVVDVYTKALVSPNTADLAATLDEDAHFTFAGEKNAHGPDAIVKAHEVLFGGFEHRNFVAGRVWHTDRSHVFEWSMTGVHTRDWMGVAPTQKPVTIGGLTLLWTKDDASITDVHVYFDEAAVKAQLGAGPKSLVSVPPSQASTVALPQARQAFDQTGSPNESANAKLVRSSLDALENSDETGYLAMMADDVEVTTLESADPARGKMSQRAYFKAMHKAIGQLDVTVENLWGIGKFVIVEYFIVGEQQGPLGWVPLQRNGVLKLFVVDVVEIRDGKIARISRYDNPAQVMAK